MTLVGPNGDGNRRKQEERSPPCEQVRTYLVYNLERVEHHSADQHRRLVISDSGLEIELGLLRELNTRLDQTPASCPAAPDPVVRSDVCQPAAMSMAENFHPGFKVTVVFNGGDEKKGIVRWTRSDPTGHDLQVL